LKLSDFRLSFSSRLFSISFFTGDEHKRHLSLFAHILLIETVLIFSIVASILIKTAMNNHSASSSSSSPSSSSLSSLFGNYKVLYEFIHLPAKTIPDQTPEREIKNPFILDIIKLKTAREFIKDNKYDEAAGIILPMNSYPMHPFVVSEKNKIDLKYLYFQKKYNEYMSLWDRCKPGELELKLLMMNCRIKAGDNENAFDSFKELFARYKLDTFTGYISKQALDIFLSRLDYDFWFDKFKFLVQSNRYSEFQKEKVHAPYPQLVSLVHAQFEYNLKHYAQSKKYLDTVANEKLLGYKEQILIKLSVREKDYGGFNKQLAAFQKKAESRLYGEVLLDAAGILMNNEEPDLALNCFFKYIDLVKYSHIMMNQAVGSGFKIPYIRNSDYWKSLWFAAWISYRKNDKTGAAYYFKQGTEAHTPAYKIANAYWYRRLSGTSLIDLHDYSFSYYYTLDGEIESPSGLKPFTALFNNPQGKELNAILEPLTGLTSYGLYDEAVDYIHWALVHEPGKLSVTDKYILEMMECIMYMRQRNYNMAYNRFREYFGNYQYVRLPRFLSAIYLPTGFNSLIDRYSRERNQDRALIYALIREESFFRADAVSPANAYGLMQLLLGTAQQTARPLGVVPVKNDLFNPDINIRFGVEHFKYLVDKYDGKPYLALAAYNAGEGRVSEWLKRFGNVPQDEFIEMIPFTETRNYVKNILRNCRYYKFYYDL
jgi:hypothetical protein